MNRYLYIPVLTLCFLFTAVSCNVDWTTEQYEHYVSFKAPMDYTTGVTDIYVKYKTDGITTYQLPVIVSGSTTNPSDIEVQVAIDSDTLASINWEYFHNRTDLYYRELTSEYFELESYSVAIPANENTGLLDINFTLSGIDLVEKWVLPLTLVESTDNSYTVHPRKNYKKALLHVIPFNDYSGSYSSTTMEVSFTGSSSVMTTNTRTAYVVDDQSVFFYAGLISSEDLNRATYKLVFRFNEDGTVSMSAENPDINLHVTQAPTWSISERMDDSQPYLMHRTISIQDFEYEFDDVTTVPGVPISYTVRGNLHMERKINIEIPDEDQAIEWD